MDAAERARLYPEILRWHPASGHRTGRWRVVRHAPPPEVHLIQLEGATGRLRLFSTLAAAQRVADQLNANP